MVKIHKDILDQEASNVPGRSMTPKYITVHNTANTDKGANAKMHARYQHNGSGGRQASWHYTVDDTEIYQTLEDNQQGWHAGDGRGKGNTQSIGIEICENSDGNFNKAVENAQWLIKKLMDKHDIPLDNVVPHKHWSGKNCPRKLLNTWNQFKAQIDVAEKPKNSKPKKSSKPKKAKPKKAKGIIADIQNALNKQYGFNIAVDNIFGPETHKALVKAYQTELNKQYNAGLVIDGIWGPKTCNATVNVRYGARGKITWIMQALLVVNGYNISVDGIYGDETSNALLSFQKDKRLKDDGIAGKATWAKLLT